MDDEDHVKGAKVFYGVEPCLCNGDFRWVEMSLGIDRGGE